MNTLFLIGRNKELFTEDIAKNEKELSEIVQASGSLVIGGAGSNGQSVTKETFKRNPRKLHVVDISENNMVELVRVIHSSFRYKMPFTFLSIIDFVRIRCLPEKLIAL